MVINILLAIDPNIAWEGLSQLVDKNPDMRLIAEATDIQSALQMAQEHQPDVVVIDINLPLPEIIQTTKNMINRAPAVKVITISMQTDRLYVEKSFLAGISGYLMKECTYEDLIPAIRMVMAGELYLSPDIQRHAS